MCVGQCASLRVVVLCVDYILHQGVRIVLPFLFGVALRIVTCPAPFTHGRRGLGLARQGFLSEVRFPNFSFRRPKGRTEKALESIQLRQIVPQDKTRPSTSGQWRKPGATHAAPLCTGRQGMVRTRVIDDKQTKPEGLLPSGLIEFVFLRKDYSSSRYHSITAWVPSLARPSSWRDSYMLSTSCKTGSSAPRFWASS